MRLCTESRRALETLTELGSSRRIEAPRFENWGEESSKDWKSAETNEQLGVPTIAFTVREARSSGLNCDTLRGGTSRQ